MLKNRSLLLEKGEGKLNKQTFNIIGWILLLVMGVSWIVFGYSSWYLLLLPLSYISFSISDGSIKKLGKLSISQATLILFALAVSVGIVFGLIQLANYVINEKLHLTGVIKTVSQIIAIIISLYPVKFTFGSIVYKIYGDSNANKT
ncbi:disulfide bond formation protein DsbD [Virgibacillus halodenitrificans]|uniref:disulfide bond formation protein DsbD n=1 Tax=Virgibacillus halodenitrificans TaxID=1482 RepID=UPI001EE63EA8|nr:disulfide bond formation protein DsbD [Virgibacillus halodenitrificans]